MAVISPIVVVYPLPLTGSTPPQPDVVAVFQQNAIGAARSIVNAAIVTPSIQQIGNDTVGYPL